MENPHELTLTYSQLEALESFLGRKRTEENAFSREFAIAINGKLYESGKYRRYDDGKKIVYAKDWVEAVEIEGWCDEFDDGTLKGESVTLEDIAEEIRDNGIAATLVFETGADRSVCLLMIGFSKAEILKRIED